MYVVTRLSTAVTSNGIVNNASQNPTGKKTSFTNRIAMTALANTQALPSKILD